MNQTSTQEKAIIELETVIYNIYIKVPQGPVNFREISSTYGGSESKEYTCAAGDLGSVPRLGRSLEKEMATHSSVLSWRFPQTEEPGRL